MLTDIFVNIYKTNAWGDAETVSGIGSELSRTQEIRANLPSLLRELGIHSLLDAGCGDWNWMSMLDLNEFEVQACDIVPELIASNNEKHGARAVFFLADLTKDVLPDVDAIMCRATLFHLSKKNIHLALKNMKRSAKFLLLTTHPNVKVNSDITDGDWRRLNLQIEPFALGTPLKTFADGPGQDGFLAVWKVK